MALKWSFNFKLNGDKTHIKFLILFLEKGHPNYLQSKQKTIMIIMRALKKNNEHQK